MELKDVKDVIDIVPTIYEDGAKPTVQETGKTVSLIPRTINAALAPLRIWIAKKEYNVSETEKLLALKLSKIGVAHIVPPEPYVGVPAIQAISYAMNSKDLRNLYANLLAKSMIDTMKDRVHPAFVEIIKQLIPDEAKLLKLFIDKDDFPLIDVQCVNDDINQSYTVIVRNFTPILEGVCENASAVTSYLDNLSRLRIIEIPAGVYLSNNEVYKPLENHPEIDKIIRTELEKGKRWNIEKKKFSVTAFGREFIDICVKDY